MLQLSLKLLRNVLALLLLLVSTAYAQGPRGGQHHGPPTPAMHLERLVKTMADASVPLSDAQQTSILSVYLDGETAEKGESTDSSTDPTTRRTQMQALQASIRKAVRAQLSDEQAKVFDVMRQPGRPGPNSSTGMPPSNGSAPDGLPSN